MLVKVEFERDGKPYSTAFYECHRAFMRQGFIELEGRAHGGITVDATDPEFAESHVYFMNDEGRTFDQSRFWHIARLGEPALVKPDADGESPPEVLLTAAAETAAAPA